MDLDEAADRLYALAPAQFTAERDALARAAKDAGDGGLSRDIGKLRRPTVSAWAVNQGSRAHAAEIGELLDLGARLREAWQDQDADTLAELTRTRGPLTTRLARLIRDLATQAGQPLSGSAPTEIEQTLDAATVDVEAADLVRQGRLSRPLNYSGFTPAPAPTTPRKPRASDDHGSSQARVKRGRSEEEVAKERREQEDRRREQLAKTAAEAERAASDAERDHAEWAAELESATRSHDRLAARVEDLTRELAAARKELAAAEHRQEIAGRDEQRARRTASSARQKARDAAALIADQPSSSAT
ncbi:hypothetical protein [Streptosporangium sp. KLBMP 9127]|nr:hypothetical protein [Streptosporangium sp. KLBMP 9127]